MVQLKPGRALPGCSVSLLTACWSGCCGIMTLAYIRNGSLSFSTAQFILIIPFQSDTELLYLEPLLDWLFPQHKKKNAFHNARTLLSIPGVMTSSLVIGWRADIRDIHSSLTDLSSISMAIQLPRLPSLRLGEELYKWRPNRLC